MPRRKKSVLRVFVEQGGVRDAYYAGTYLACWGICAENVGHAPGVDELSEFWGQGRVTTWRHSKAFDRCAGGVSVADVWASLPTEVRRKQKPEARDRLFADVSSAKWAL